MESEKLYPTILKEVSQTATFTQLTLSANAQEYSIYTSPTLATLINKIVHKTDSERPQTHDLINSLFKGFEINPLKLIIKEQKNSIYYCRLTLEKNETDQKSLVEIDVRPTDGIAIALEFELPIYTTETILNAS